MEVLGGVPAIAQADQAVEVLSIKRDSQAACSRQQVAHQPLAVLQLASLREAGLKEGASLEVRANFFQIFRLIHWGL